MFSIISFFISFSQPARVLVECKRRAARSKGNVDLESLPTHASERSRENRVPRLKQNSVHWMRLPQHPQPVVAAITTKVLLWRRLPQQNKTAKWWRPPLTRYTPEAARVRFGGCNNQKYNKNNSNKTLSSPLSKSVGPVTNLIKFS